MEVGLDIRRKQRAEPVAECGGIIDIALPYRNDAPAQRLKRLGRGGVALNIVSQLWNPIVAARSRYIRQLAARVLVPKASVHLDNRVVPRQDNVRIARQVAPVEAKAVTHGMQASTHDELRLRVLLPVTSHDPRSCRRNGGLFRLHPVPYDYAARRRACTRVATLRKGSRLSQTRTMRYASVS